MIDYKEVTTQKHYLRPYIKTYTYAIGTLYECEAKHITRAFPTVLTHIYFEFYGDLSEFKGEKRREKITKRTYINTGIGSWLDIYQLVSREKIRFVKNFKVSLYPHVLYEVFGISPLDILKEDIQIEDIFGETDASLLYEALESASNGALMIEIFERYFTNKLLSISQKRKKFIPYLLTPDTTLKSLSKNIGYSERWIQKQYSEVFGLSFKKIQNNKRFLKTLHTINMQIVTKREKIQLSTIAYEHGYFDQAHFIKEFKRYTGMNPSTYIKQKEKTPLDFFW